MNHSKDPSTLQSHLGFWLRLVSNKVSMRFQGLLAERGYSVTDWVALRSLFDRKETAHAELIQVLGMTKGATSKVVSRLEDKALVKRKLAQGSGREQVLILTAAGKALVPTLAALADENDAFFFGHLDPQEQKSLTSSLQRLAAHHGFDAPPVD